MATNTDLIQQLYVAYYNRPADTGGLAFWVGKLDAGVSLDAVSKAFNSAKEYTDMYNGKNAESIVDTVYMNLFGRHAEQGGLNFWAPKVAAGQAGLPGGITTADLVKFIGAGAIDADGKPNADGIALANKATAAAAFTADLLLPGNEAARLAYANDNAAGRTFVAGVTDDASLATAITNVHAATQSSIPTPPVTVTSLTSAVDVFVGGAGNDTINATGVTLSALDNIDGGAGSNVLSVQDPSSLLGGGLPSGTTIKNIQTFNVNTAGSIGSAGSAGVPAVAQTKTYTFATPNAGTDVMTVNYGGLSTVITTGASATIAGDAFVAAINGMAGATIAVNVAGVVTLTAPVAGTPLVNVTFSGATVPADVPAIAAGVANVVGSPASSAVVYDVSGVTGLTTLTATANGTVNVKVGEAVSTTVANSGNGGVTVTGGTAATITTGTGAVLVAGNAGGLTTATVTGGSDITVQTNAVTGAVDKLTSVSLSGYTGATAAIQSDALTTLSLKSSAVGATVSAAAATRALTVNVDGITGAATITDAEATSLTLNAAGAASSVTLAANKATTLTVGGTKAVTVALGATADLTAINAASSAGVTVTTALADTIAFTGGSGADTVTVGTTSKAIAMGAGDDTVKLTAVGVTGSVAGGAGSDTLATTAALGVTATADTTLSAKVTGFEVLSLGAVGAGSAIHLANLNNAGANAITKVTVAGATAALTVDGLTANNTIEFTADAGTQVITTSLADNTGTADVLNVSIKNTAAIGGGNITAAGVETVKFATDDTATTPTGIQHTATLTDAAAKAITVTGDAGLNLTFTGTALTSFDASGVTKGAVTWTSGALDNAATITGGAGNNTIVFSLATKAVTYTGGALIDDVTTGNANNTVNTGAGNDVIHLGSGNNTVNAGTGNDQIFLGAGLNTVTGGGGNDAYSLSGVTIVNGNTYSTITDFGTGDTLAFTDAGAYDGSATLGAKITLANTAAFADFLQAATAGATAGEIKWFQYGGDTYVVNDASATAAYVNGTDQIVKLTGLIDLSASTTAATGIVTYVAAA